MHAPCTSRYGNNAGPWWRAARAMQSVIRISSPVQSGATQPVRIIVTCTRCVCIYKRVNPLKNSVIDHAVNTIFARHGNTKAIQRKTAKSCNALHVIARVGSLFSYKSLSVIARPAMEGKHKRKRH